MFLGLGREHALSLITVALALAVLLVGVLHADVLVHKILPIHIGNGVVGSFEVAIGDEAIALGQSLIAARNLGWSNERAEARESVIEGLFVDEGVEVTDEELSAHFGGLLLVCGGLVTT